VADSPPPSLPNPGITGQGSGAGTRAAFPYSRTYIERDRGPGPVWGVGWGNVALTSCQDLGQTFLSTPSLTTSVEMVTILVLTAGISGAHPTEDG